MVKLILCTCQETQGTLISYLSTIEVFVGSSDRLNMLADDIIAHYEDRQYVLTGKAMIVSMTLRITINLYKTLLEKRPD
ncbi:hypothetical protein Q5O24_06545 [Eubacteriaceae bacterium ES3]|nr:hypothetical protein Q5O24_06545 [Eubacteriaceae bacterium ES3]